MSLTSGPSNAARARTARRRIVALSLHAASTAGSRRDGRATRVPLSQPRDRARRDVRDRPRSTNRPHLSRLSRRVRPCIAHVHLAQGEGSGFSHHRVAVAQGGKEGIDRRSPARRHGGGSAPDPGFWVLQRPGEHRITKQAQPRHRCRGRPHALPPAGHRGRNRQDRHRRCARRPPHSAGVRSRYRSSAPTLIWTTAVQEDFSVSTHGDLPSPGGSPGYNQSSHSTKLSRSSKPCAMTRT